MSYSFQQFDSLEGPRLRMRRLGREDLIPLAESLISASTWFAATRKIDTPSAFQSYFEKVLQKQDKGELLALVAEFQGQFVAMSVFQYPSEEFRRIEIGFSWVSDVWQRTFVNSEMKLLMLEYAFSTMKVKRVEFSVHPENAKSNLAMQRLGAKYEGTLRKWRFLPGLIPDDGNRNLYSIIDDEWPGIKQRLCDSLSRQ